MSNPLVSIILPVFNVEQYLPNTIASILQQTWPELEVIVVDDGSLDKTAMLATRAGLPRMRMARQANRGAAASRNAGIRLAQGKYIQFLDGDDMISPDKIELQVKMLEDNPGFVASCAWGRFYDGDESALFRPETIWADVSGVNLVTHCRGENSMMHPGCWLAPRDVVERAGFWDERLTLDDDGEFFSRVALAAEGVKFVPVAESYYRSGLPQSLSKGRSRRAWESQLLSVELSAKALFTEEDSPRTRKAIADCYQRLSHDIWSDFPDLGRQAAARVAKLGGSDITPGGGRLYQLGASLGGWRNGRRLEKAARSILGTMGARNPHTHDNPEFDIRQIRVRFTSEMDGAG